MKLSSLSRTEYHRTDLVVVCLANTVNVVMSILFVARILDLTQAEYDIGIFAMAIGFALGYIALRNRMRKRDKWDFYLLVPIFLFFVVDFFLDYATPFEFRSTAVAGPYVALYFAGLWGLIGYSFRYDRRWGYVTLVTYFLNMTLSVLAHYL